MYTAPPLIAEFSVKLESNMFPVDVTQSIAPPLPPVALLLVNEEDWIVLV